MCNVKNENEFIKIIGKPLKLLVIWALKKNKIKKNSMKSIEFNNGGGANGRF